MQNAHLFNVNSNLLIFQHHRDVGTPAGTGSSRSLSISAVAIGLLCSMASRREGHLAGSPEMLQLVGARCCGSQGPPRPAADAVSVLIDGKGISLRKSMSGSRRTRSGCWSSCRTPPQTLSAGRTAAANEKIGG